MGLGSSGTFGKSVDFALYLHWPYCQSKCPYCDFNSHVSATIDHHRWRNAYLSEIDRLGAETDGRILGSVFFGGGTPSLMPPDLVEALLDRIRATWRVTNDWEVSLEANPGSVEAGRFRAYRTAGVNRLSVGIQALNDADLRQLGRLHSAKEAEAALAIARDTFDRVSFDLIYARQDQSLEAWRKELAHALTVAGDHISLYQLTIEAGTAFGDRLKRGRLGGLPDEDLSVALYQMTQDMCADAGLPAYEVSNHAKEDAQSRHNLAYWHCRDYLGIGPGAHGRLTTAQGRYSTESHRTPGLWLMQVEKSGSGELPRERLLPREQSQEYLMMSLRLIEGIDLKRYEALAGTALDQQKVAELVSLGLVDVGPKRLRATGAGMLVLNSIIRELAVN